MPSALSCVEKDINANEAWKRERVRVCMYACYTKEKEARNGIGHRLHSHVHFRRILCALRHVGRYGFSHLIDMPGTDRKAILNRLDEIYN